jgi:hypothetical protein
MAEHTSSGSRSGCSTADHREGNPTVVRAEPLSLTQCALSSIYRSLLPSREAAR